VGFVGSKSQQRWLWNAIDHHTGELLAYVLAAHEDEALMRLKDFLEPFGGNHFYMDGWRAYKRHLNPAEHRVGKRNTQKYRA
jgi:insertion element IS1 protein InsB